MATYDSQNVNQPGQYPAVDAFTKMGLPAQDFGTGAPGGPQFAPPTDVDQGHTVIPGEYPSRMPFTGTPLDGTGSPGTQGIPAGSTETGPDSVTYTEFTGGFKPSRETEPGDEQGTASAPVSGTSDWTQANGQSYGGADQFFLPGIAGNMPSPGSGRFQTGAGQVRVGGFQRGQRG